MDIFRRRRFGGAFGFNFINSRATRSRRAARGAPPHNTKAVTSLRTPRFTVSLFYAKLFAFYQVLGLPGSFSAGKQIFRK